MIILMMAELSKEETSKLWDDIQLYWDIKKGKVKGDVQKAERDINRIQGLLGLEVTDFQVDISTGENKEEYTVAKAESVFTEKEIENIDKSLDRAIALRELIADMVITKYPKLKNNPAGIGQMVNITYDLVKDKLK